MIGKDGHLVAVSDDRHDKKSPMLFASTIGARPSRSAMVPAIQYFAEVSGQGHNRTAGKKAP